MQVELSNDFNMPDTYPSDGCNGMGSGWSRHLIPDTIYGLNMRPVACIHDWAYSVGRTPEDKSNADREFLNNMLRIIEAKSGWWFPHFLARRRALKYYTAVVNFGGPAFFTEEKVNA